jgi:hypothetical protein
VRENKDKRTGEVTRIIGRMVVLLYLCIMLTSDLIYPSNDSDITRFSDSQKKHPDDVTS